MNDFSQPLLQIKNLSKSYFMGKLSVSVLHNISFSVNKGEFVSIMGPSGCGKSTLMNLIGCLDRPTNGDIYLKGVNVSTLKDEDLARIRNKEIGFVFQTFNLLPRISAIENVEVPLVYSGISRAQRKNKSYSALESMGIAQFRRAAAKLKKELALLQKDQEKAESRENAKNNGLWKAFMKRKLSELEKRICFYLLTIMFDDMDSFRIRGADEVKTVMSVVCADGIADPLDTLCDYILLGRLNKIDLFELKGWSGDKIFEKNLAPARCLIEAAVGSMKKDNNAPRYKNKKREMLSLMESQKNSSIHKPSTTLGHVVLTQELRKKVDDFIWFYRKKSNKKSCWDLKGLGLSTGNALFYGPPGTGKTMLAEAIAGELKLEIVKVRYEEIIDCWVGQSEKNIKKVFSTSGRVILFDECDAMLEARSSAKDSVDRMNNRIINIILQELERYQGIVIFTTNRAVELDEALGRRILLKMEIPRPGWEERQEIWKKMTVGKVPLEEGIEWERIADHDLSGGEIKNAILNLAKDPDVNRPEVKVTTQHLLMAAEKEANGRLCGAKKKFGFDTN